MSRWAAGDPMVRVFWIGAIWLGYVYVGYPLLLGVIAFVRRVHPVMRDDFLPRVSVLIAARNEEKDIGWKLSQTLGWDYPEDRLEVLVASDASDDGTDEIIGEFAGPRLTFVRMEQRSGKNAALNCLAKQARGDLLFFTDANSQIEPGCLRRIVRHFADRRVGCVTGEMHYVEEDAAPHSASGERLYWSYESLIKRLESRIGYVLICVGSTFCMRRNLFVPLAADLANDVELPLRTRCAGYWVRYEPTVRSTERVTRLPSEEFARRRRTCAQGMLAMWKLHKTLHGFRGWQYISRRFLRWLTLVPLLLLLVSTGSLAARSPLLAAVLGVQLLFYGLALAGGILAIARRKSIRFASIPFHLMLVYTAALVGVVDTCCGRRFRVWEIASLSRGGQEGSWEGVR